MDVEGELHNSPPHGQKRHPEDDLQSEQRLAKRFNLLNLGINPFVDRLTSTSNRAQDTMASFLSPFKPLWRAAPVRMLLATLCTWTIREIRFSYTI